MVASRLVEMGSEMPSKVDDFARPQEIVVRLVWCGESPVHFRRDCGLFPAIVMPLVTQPADKRGGRGL